jgi:hypothetical protein
MDFSPTSTVTSDRDFDDMTDEELDKYFASYEPLSNLPTPPPAKEIMAPATPSSSTRCQPLEAQIPLRTPELEG